MMGDLYTIADVALFPWINNLVGFYGAGELVGFDDFANVKRVLAKFLERPAVQRGVDLGKDMRRTGQHSEEARKILFGQTAQSLGA